MAITRTPIIDDDGSGTTGTVIDNAWKQEFYDQIDAVAGGLTVVTSAAVGTLNDWVIPGRTSNTLVRWTGGSDSVVTGVANGIVGDRLTIINYSTVVLYFAHYATGSAANARFVNTTTSSYTPIAPGGTVTYVFADINAWLLVNHEQGAWIQPLFVATNFVANAGTWTVEAGDVLNCRYR